MNDIEKPKIYRTLVSHDIMINNNELVEYFSHKITGEESGGRLVLCREVFQEELDAGLDINYRGSIWDEEIPKVTRVLDAYYRVRTFFEVWEDIQERTPDPSYTPMSLSTLLTHQIAINYYDCLSGGCPSAMLSVFRHIIEKYNIDRSLEVYPSDDKWYTIDDFMNDTKSVERFEDIIEECLMPSLPLLGCS